MNGFIKTLSMAALVGGMLASVGCGPNYHNVVDPCYPERYNAIARSNVREAMAPQVQNGHILDQTVWNTYFEPGTAKLNKMGIERLNYLGRRRPTPDTTVYLQTAHDSESYNPEKPQEYVSNRQNLDRARIEAVRNYLNASTAGRGLAFNVELHDPATADVVGQPNINMLAGQPKLMLQLPVNLPGAAPNPVYSQQVIGTMQAQGRIAQ